MVDIPQQFQRSESTTTRTTHTVEEPQSSLLSNILAIVGFIILIVVVIWGLVNLAGVSSTWFSSLFGKSENVIEVTAPKSAKSGESFSISWKYKEPTPGTYAFLYQCQGGLQLQTPGPAGGMNGIPCGAAFTIASVNNTVSVTPLLSGNSELDVPVSIIFMPSATSTDSTSSPQASSGKATEQAQGSATVRILPSETPALDSTGSPQAEPTPTPAPTPTPTPAPAPVPAPAPKTPADLSVRITSVTTDGYGNGTAVFDIVNVGGTSSGTYYFTANLPTQSGYTYTSPAQSSLAPGSHIISTLRFSQAASGVFSVSITTPDSNQSNNYASQSLNAPYYNSYNYNYNNYPYQYQAQYSSASYPSQYQYQTYPNSYQYSYPQNYQYPYTYQQYPYTQQYPYAY